MIDSEQIKTIRANLKMTQDALAQQLGVAPFTVRRWEAGTSRPSRLAERELNRLLRKKASNKGVAL